MPYIPDAYTDTTPAAVEYHNRLYVAFKDNDSQHIRMAYTGNPDDNTSWTVIDLPMRFSGVGPADILTCTQPALAVVADSLWLAFKDAANNRIWLVSMCDGTYRGQGFLRAAQTSEAPSMDGPMVVYRGDEDQGIWFSFVQTQPGEQRIPHDPAQTYGTPAVVHMPNGRPMVAFRANEGDEIRYTYLGHVYPHPGDTWTEPAAIPGALSANDPALCVHDGAILMAYNTVADYQIHIASYGEHGWTAHGTVPHSNTLRAPALVSFGDRLYVLFKGHNNDRVWYQEVPVDTYHHTVEIGYRPNPNGFRFVNFSEGAPDWSTFRDTFGHSEIDAKATAATLDLIFCAGLHVGLLFYAFYGVYKGFTDGSLNTGMCSGYAAASLRRYWDGSSPSLYTEFGSASRASALPGGIRRELTVDFGRLLGGETLTELLGQCEAGQASVGRCLRAVSQDLATGSGLHTGRIVFFVPAGRIWEENFLSDLTLTHAVVPYKIDYPVTGAGGRIRMYVYDCNNPGNNSAAYPDGHSYIEFTEVDGGQYEFCFYTGSSSSSASDLSSTNGFTLASMTLQDYLFRDISLPLYLNYVVDLLNCPAELHILNPQGKFTGHKGGRVHWQIPGSYPLYPSARGFLLPRGRLTREICGTGDGLYTFYSLNPDGSGVLLHGEARGGSRPSRETLIIDRTARTISIRSLAGRQRLGVALRTADANGIRVVALSKIDVEEDKPLKLAYSAGLESLRGTYAGAGHPIEAEVLHLRPGEQVPRRAQAQPRLEQDQTLQLRLGYGAQVTIRE